jgi:hypothetical protein
LLLHFELIVSPERTFLLRIKPDLHLVKLRKNRTAITGLQIIVRQNAARKQLETISLSWPASIRFLFCSKKVRELQESSCTLFWDAVYSCLVAGGKKLRAEAEAMLKRQPERKNEKVLDGG